MSKRGRKKKPTELKVLEGTHREDRDSNPVVVDDALQGLPEPPEDLSIIAKKEWKRLAEGLANMGVLSKIDKVAFEAYCHNYAVWKRTKRKVNNIIDNPDGRLLYKTSNDNLQQIPLVHIEKKYYKMMMESLREFGLTPSSRADIAATAADAKKGDIWDEIIKTKNED